MGGYHHCIFNTKSAGWTISKSDGTFHGKKSSIYFYLSDDQPDADGSIHDCDGSAPEQDWYSVWTADSVSYSYGNKY